MSEHWTVPYIGLPYHPAGTGPQAFNCWHFFRHVQRNTFGRELPALPVPDGLALTAVMRTFRDRANVVGWDKVDLPRRSGDAVLMGHRNHPHHIGVYVDDVGEGAVLHCVAGAGVVLPSLLHLELGGWQITGTYRHGGH